MPDVAHPTALGVHDTAVAVRAGTLTPDALVDALLARSARLDGELAAWIDLDPECARLEARMLTEEARAGRFRGPLHGVPVAIKDNFDVAARLTRAGSQLLEPVPATHDAAAVRRLRAAGALVLGKTAMTVFAAMDAAATRNPWNRECTPGGSSSGSAAAVAADLAPAAIGSQTAGSVIRPAAYCGVVGLKPTYDAIDRAGLYPCAWSMDHVGPLARSVTDVALLFAALAGRDAHVPAPASLRGKVIGVPGGFFREAAAPATLAALDRLLDRLRAGGADVRPVALPASFDAGMEAGILVMYAEMAAVHAGRFPAERERYAWKLAILLDAGRSITAIDLLRAQQVRHTATADLGALLATVDCLITPSTPAPAPRGLDATGDWRFNLPFSASGHPALTVPVALDESGLPIGVQLVARHGGERRLFDVGAAIERIASFPSSPYRDR